MTNKLIGPFEASLFTKNGPYSLTHMCCDVIIRIGLDFNRLPKVMLVRILEESTRFRCGLCKQHVMATRKCFNCGINGCIYCTHWKIDDRQRNYYLCIVCDMVTSKKDKERVKWINRQRKKIN